MPVVPLLAAFSTLAMLLLVRLQLSQQRRQWARRHIADTGEVGRLFLRSGSLFVVIAVLGASSLTAWASIDRQDIDLGDLQDPLEEIGAELSGWLTIVGLPPPEARTTTIGDSWSVANRWPQPSGIAFRAYLDGDLRGNYWWGSAHDTFDGSTWERRDLDTIATRAGDTLEVPPLASAGGDAPLTATITIAGEGVVQGTAFRPAEARSVDRDVEAIVIDKGGGVGDVVFMEPLEAGDSVVVEAMVRDYRTDEGSLTSDALREAGEDYPDWTDRYLQGTGAAVSGRRVMREARRIEDGSKNPYDRAVEAQDFLRSMTYQTDMRGVCDPDDPVPECVLKSRQGFCQHYATTMVMLLRNMGIPARIITGYLSGERDGDTWVVDQAAYHNWVEAYFPGYGWVRFDPTPRDEYGSSPTAFGSDPAATTDREGDRPPDRPATWRPRNPSRAQRCWVWSVNPMSRRPTRG